MAFSTLEILFSFLVKNFVKVLIPAYFPSTGVSTLLFKSCHSVQYPLEGCKKQENGRCFINRELKSTTKVLFPLKGGLNKAHLKGVLN